jgi:hypothetical protein
MPDEVSLVNTQHPQGAQQGFDQPLNSQRRAGG